MVCQEEQRLGLMPHLSSKQNITGCTSTYGSPFSCFFFVIVPGCQVIVALSFSPPCNAVQCDCEVLQLTREWHRIPGALVAPALLLMESGGSCGNRTGVVLVEMDDGRR
jgi:hypothetical protein